MKRTLTSTLAALALLFALPLTLTAQSKGQGNERTADKGKGKAAAAVDQRMRGQGSDDRAEAAGRSDDLNRGRVRAAEVRELRGAVAGPAEMARVDAEARAFRSSVRSTRYFRAFDPSDTPERWRAIALSPRLTERYAGRVATLALARGVPQEALVLRARNDRVLITNPAGVVLLDLDDEEARNLGAWRVVGLDADDEGKKDSPAFCRTGAGHPNWGRQWCIDKGFGLGRSNDMRWGRAVSVEDVLLRPAPSSSGDLTRDVLASVLGSVVVNRLAAHAITLGLVDPLVGRWAVEPTGRRVLLVSSGSVPVAEIVDTNKDDRADLMLIALKSW